MEPTALPVEVKMADPGDFASGRRNILVDTLVIHTTEGDGVEGALEWWHREDVVASAHYLLDGDPLRIVQNVAEGDTAFHAGSRAMNRRSIGIEVCGRSTDPKTWTPAVFELLVVLAADICRRHRIPVVHQPGPGICGHADVPDPYHPDRYGGASHHTDPGPHFPWDRFLDALRAELAGGVPAKETA